MEVLDNRVMKKTDLNLVKIINIHKFRRIKNTKKRVNQIFII